VAGLAGFFIDKVTFHAYDPEFADVPGAVAVWDKTVDASKREGHGFKVLAPKHPVFRGIPVTDNARPEPDEFSCNVFFTNTGSRIDESIIKLLQDNAESVRQTFEDLAKKGSTWTIDTSLKIYKNMMLTAGDVERTVESGNSIMFGLRFTEVRSATASFTTASIRKPSVKAAAAVVKKGAQVGAKSATKATAAANILDAVRR
jgi:hypothetical protein